MRPRASLLGAMLLAALVAHPARAHFLFISIGPDAEAGRAAEVFFSERAAAGDPRFVDKIAGTKLWVQTEPGRFELLAVRPGHDRLRAQLPAAGSLSVSGVLDYGVLARPLAKPFLLRHYPKAIAGRAEELNRLQPSPHAALEIVPTIEADGLKLAVLLTGRPLPRAKLTTVDLDLIGDELETDDQGVVVWSPPGPGRYAIYLGHTLQEAGQHGGQHYEEIRQFATLALNWPLEPPAFDPEAVALFQQALEARARWSDFPGFTAEFNGVVEGRSVAGTVAVKADGEVSLESDDEVAQEWIAEALESLVMHRLASASSEPPRLRFADDDAADPRGRLLAAADGQFGSSYRIADGQIMGVNRHLGDQLVTITVLANRRNAEGRYLPASYTVQTFNADGTLRESQAVRDRWQRVDRWDLPLEHWVSAASSAGMTVKTFVLRDHRLENQPPAEPAARAQPGAATQTASP